VNDSVYRGEETGFEFVSAGRAYAFDADGGLLRLASEAYRIRLAHLFDPYLAVSASQIEALPHQITAVYREMLPRQPLRFLLADDPGAGKTIMADLLVKELLIRGDLERCLIVAPRSLVEQWQEEMAEKFGLGFDLLTRDQIEASITGNPFVEKMLDAATGLRRKVIIFTEPKDTLEYLQQKITARVTGPTSPSKPRRFYGSVEIDMVRPVKSFDAILNAVVMELQRTQGAKVRLTLEIQAEANDGLADSEVSVVRDNARQLKFKAESTGFEE